MNKNNNNKEYLLNLPTLTNHKTPIKLKPQKLRSNLLKKKKKKKKKSNFHIKKYPLQEKHKKTRKIRKIINYQASQNKLILKIKKRKLSHNKIHKTHNQNSSCSFR
jgi:hypothetical protein